LSDDTFVSKAPSQVVESIRRKLADYEEQLRKIEGALGEPS
jgi:valyl-tRNA synthetase